MVWFFEAQRIDHQGIHPFQERHLAWIDGFHIGDIRQWPDAIGEDRQLSMHDHEGCYFDIADRERLVWRHLMQQKFWYSRIMVFVETIRHGLAQRLGGVGVGEDIDIVEFGVVDGAEGSQVVDARHMVVVYVRDEHTIDFAERHPQHLLAEIGSAVYDDACVLRLYHRRGAQSVVVRIRAGTDLALASDGGYAPRCTCTKKSELHVREKS